MTGQKDKPIVTRFAPSPTGNLHIGGARTALFAWAFARKHGGQLILRIEDTDLARSTPESTQGILRDLKWLGLNWDQGPIADAQDPYAPDGQKGGHGPYFQSQRHKAGIYDKLIQKLLDSGQAYEDDDAVRFRMDRDIAFDDVVFGHIEIKAADLEDFIIRKGDKGGRLPTFHFAVTVDDAMMEVTHVIRGQEHLANTPKHAALCDALGFDRPQWVHLPSIMNADGSKMSKRDKAKAARKAAADSGLEPTGDEMAAFLAKDNDSTQIADEIATLLGLTLPEIEVADFKRSGYVPTVLLNYIALLGWNPGDDTERFDMDFLIKHFSPERIGKKNSQFDRTKLAKFNGEVLAEMPAEQFHDQLLGHFKSQHPTFLDKLGDANFRTFATMYQARAQTLNTPTEMGRFFVCSDDKIEYNAKAVKKNLAKNDGEGLNVLKQFRVELGACDDWTGDTLHNLIESFVEKNQLKNMGSIAQPLRVALTGNAVSPEIGPTLELLGKETVLNRIDRCINTFNTESN
jgi:glutamyl/glutaminyl-tRNA synthetase